MKIVTGLGTGVEHSSCMVLVIRRYSLNNLLCVKPNPREKVAEAQHPDPGEGRRAVAREASLANRSGRDSPRVAPAVPDAPRDAPF